MAIKMSYDLRARNHFHASQYSESYIKLPSRRFFNEISHLKPSYSKPSLGLPQKINNVGQITSSALNDRTQNNNNKNILLQPLESSTPANRRSVSEVSAASTVTNCVSRCIYKTKTGAYLGIHKTDNQDNFIIKANLQGTKGMYLFSVCDGHGEEGHLVSQFIKDNLAKMLEFNLSKYPCEEAFNKSIEDLVGKMLHTKINTKFSGSTLVSVFIVGDTIICANIGDSRAVLATKKNSWVAIDLSRDHKPDVNEESQRILQAGGRIHSMNNGPLRIWLPDEDVPGLSMTRSIGDTLCTSIGLIYKPEIITRKIIINDKFIIIASDGIWEYINSKEAVDICAELCKSGNSQSCCEILMKEAVKRWKENSDSIDDITIIVVFLSTKKL